MASSNAKNWILKIMLECSLTVAEMSDKVGCSDQTIRNLVNGGGIGPKTVKSIRAAFPEFKLEGHDPEDDGKEKPEREKPKKKAKKKPGKILKIKAGDGSVGVEANVAIAINKLVDRQIELVVADLRERCEKFEKKIERLKSALGGS